MAFARNIEFFVIDVILEYEKVLFDAITEQIIYNFRIYNKSHYIRPAAIKSKIIEITLWYVRIHFRQIDRERERERERGGEAENEYL